MNTVTDALRRPKGKLGKVLTHLEEYGWITGMKSMDLYNYYRLSDGIAKLKKIGYRIDCIMEKSTTGSAYGKYVYLDYQQKN